MVAVQQLSKHRIYASPLQTHHLYYKSVILSVGKKLKQLSHLHNKALSSPLCSSASLLRTDVRLSKSRSQSFCAVSPNNILLLTSKIDMHNRDQTFKANLRGNENIF